MALPPGPAGLKFWQPRNERTDSWHLLYALGGATALGPGLNGYTVRQLISVTAFDASLAATGTQVRVTIKGASSGGASWDNMYVGHAAPAGDNIDFDGTQVRLLFSGNDSGTVAANQTLVSNPVNYAFDKTKNLIVSIHFTAYSDIWANTTATGFTARFRSAVDEAATTDVAGGSYSTSASACFGFAAVEVYSGPVTNSGPITLPADGGSYTLTGSNVGLGLGYWLTGSDVTFTTASAGSTTLAAAAGSYALTGTAAALAYSATLPASAGSYAITGSAVGLGLGYWITGTGVTFTTAAGGGTTLTASAGSYTLNGTDAAFVLPAPPTTDNYTGGGVRRIRKFARKRKREELEELLDAIAVTPPEVAAAPPLPEMPPAPGLLADVPTPPRTVLRSPPDEDEDEIALLLELIS